MARFKDIFRKHRLELGMTQEEIAKTLGLSPSAIGMYEQGKRTPSDETLFSISRLFGISVDELLGFTPTAIFENEGNLLIHATAYLRIPDSEMCQLLIAKGIKILDMEQYRNIKDGSHTPEGLREAIKQICQERNMENNLLARLGFQENPNLSVPDEQLRIALFGGDDEVSDEMWEEAKNYALYIKERERKKREGK